MDALRHGIIHGKKNGDSLGLVVHIDIINVSMELWFIFSLLPD